MRNGLYILNLCWQKYIQIEYLILPHLIFLDYPFLFQMNESLIICVIFFIKNQKHYPQIKKKLYIYLLIIEQMKLYD